MIKIIIPASERFDESTSTFINTPETMIHLEHSLVSISKWESKWKTPFLSKDEKTTDQVIDYVKCMSLEDVDDEIYNSLTTGNMIEISNYIDSPMTATTFSEQSNKTSSEIITSEIIYYWMITFNIPMECQNWHINRLLTLIRVCNIKNSPDKKMSKNDIARRNRALNEARLKKLNTRG